MKITSLFLGIPTYLISSAIRFVRKYTDGWNSGNYPKLFRAFFFWVVTLKTALLSLVFGGGMFIYTLLLLFSEVTIPPIVSLSFMWFVATWLVDLFLLKVAINTCEHEDRMQHMGE